MEICNRLRIRPAGKVRKRTSSASIRIPLASSRAAVADCQTRRWTAGLCTTTTAATNRVTIAAATAATSLRLFVTVAVYMEADLNPYSNLGFGGYRSFSERFGVDSGLEVAYASAIQGA